MKRRCHPILQNPEQLAEAMPFDSIFLANQLAGNKRATLAYVPDVDLAHMIYVGHLFEACGYANQGFDIFLARGLRRGNADPEREEQDLATRDYPLPEVERMIRDGEIKDATTVAALGLLRLKGLL
jgi:ADP-ribose pyrophosphatase